jgi:hypothetical protein
MAEVVERLDNVERRLTSVEKGLSELREEVGGLRGEVGGLRGEVGGLRGEVHKLRILGEKNESISSGSRRFRFSTETHSRTTGASLTKLLRRSSRWRASMRS